MTKLTNEQKQFLADLLLTRERSKGVLGGRALDKIKTQYKDYCKRQRKAAEALRNLQELSQGVELGAECQALLAQVDKQVTAASDLGDESVFASVYPILAKIEKDATSIYETRKAELKKIASEVQKFTETLEKIKRINDSNKKTTAVNQLRDLTYQWLKTHHALDRQPVWSIYQEVVELAGGPDDHGLSLTVDELDRESFELRQRIEACDPTELGAENSEFPALVKDLAERIESCREVAESKDRKVLCKMLDRTALVVNQLLWLVDPPLPPDGLPLPPQLDNVPLQDPTPQTTNGTQQEAPLSNAELAVKKLKDAKGIIEYAEKDLAQTKKDLLELQSSRQKLLNEDNTLRKLLEAEFELLNDGFQEVTDQISETEKLLKTANDEYQKADQEKTTEGKWEEHVEAIADAVDDAQRLLSLIQRPFGRIEGGLVYIDRSLVALKSFKPRLEKIDANLLATVKGKLPLLKECEQVPVTGDQLDMVKHLMLTSELANDKMSSSLAKARDARGVEKLVRSLMDSPKIGTIAITGMLASCHQLVTDVERYYSDQSTFVSTLGDLKDKFRDVGTLAKQDLGQYTAPVIVPLEGEKLDGQQSVGVAVVGGGPIGLLSAVEARMSGAAQVHVYEGRSDPYSRMNVLKIEPAAAQRLTTAGVSETVFPEGYGKNNVACVKTIEEALEARCKNLGVKLERGLFLKDVKRNDQGQTLLYFKGQEDQPKSCDLLIVATGASVASAQRYADNVVLSTVLGIPFQKAQVKDYAGVGLFKKDSPKPGDKEFGSKTPGWSYDFETEEVKYLVSQLTEEEYDEYARNPRALLERLQEEAELVSLAKRPVTTRPIRQSSASKDETIGPDELEQAINDAWTQVLTDIGPENFWGSETARKDDERAVAKAKVAAKKGLLAKLKVLREKTPQAMLSPLTVENSVITAVMNVLGVARFPIEIQQAQQFVGKEPSGVLVGDSGATPHPSTAKGLNTGIAEMGAVRDLVSGLRRGTGSEQERQDEMQVYDFEVKRRTDVMVGAGLFALQTGARERIGKLVKKATTLLEGKGFTNEQLGPWTGASIRYLNTVVIARNSPEEKKDVDWSRREQAVQTLRKYESDLVQAIVAMQQLLDNDEKDIGKVLAPLIAIIPTSTPSTPSTGTDESTKDKGDSGDQTTDTGGSGSEKQESQQPSQQETKNESKKEDEYVAPDPMEPVIDGSLSSNPTLYFVPNKSGGNNYYVGDQQPDGQWQSIEQFCSYLSAHWLSQNMTTGLKFSDLKDPQAAIRALVQMGGDTGNRSGLVNQVNFAKNAIGGQEEQKAQLLDDLTQGKLNAGTKIWFGTDRHALAATVGRLGVVSLYDPDSGKVQRLTAPEFIQRADSCTSFVVART